MSKNILEKIISRLTPEKMEKLKQKRIKHKNELTTDFQFGYYVGENIVNRFLPTLSVEPGTRTLIEVSEEDSIKYNNIETEWYNKRQQDKDSADIEWTNYQNYRKLLNNKYLPNPLLCYVNPLNILNIEDFKKGLIWSLWDCDHCNYNLDAEKIKIYDDKNAFFTIIEFELKN